MILYIKSKTFSIANFFLTESKTFSIILPNICPAIYLRHCFSLLINIINQNKICKFANIQIENRRT